VRKGSAFPTLGSHSFYEAMPHDSEAEPPNNFGEASSVRQSLTALCSGKAASED
jgi:hypothetical protein